ncbi:MAG: glycosyltransferase [Actinomycetota bacterium]|nr:glycosyltransferase [Actinomycetota bacterium]
MGSEGPTSDVGIVVVNHNGGELTLRCLRSLIRTEWPTERLRVVLVDNASSDGISSRVKSELQEVTVVDTGSNLGFGGGCNAGLRSLGDVDYVALVNNDATVDPGWLVPLVAAIEAEPAVGAASPRILFDGAFVDVFLDSSASIRGRGDGRRLGVRVSGVRLDGEDAWSSVQVVSGFWGAEHDAVDGSPFEWTNGSGHLRIKARDDGSLPTCALRLSSDDVRAVVARSGPSRREVVVGTEPEWHDVALGGEPFDVVNNVGSVLLRDGYGADRGYLQRDDGSYTEPEEVFAWCGAAVLLSCRYLETVGTFAEEFFLYYEDLDLSWRGRAQGWRHVYVPDSVVRHVHSASTVTGSQLFDHYVERNHLLTLVRNAPARLAWRAAVRHVLITGSYFRRDVVSPVARGAKPSSETVRRRLSSFVAFVATLPRATEQRRRLRSAQRVPDAELMKWVESQQHNPAEG